jgi:hypothetical protein
MVRLGHDEMLDKLMWLRRCGLVIVLAGLLGTTLPAAAELSAVDREAIEAAFARADTNGDGKLSREEAQRFPEIAARFAELDRDRDGFLSFAEFAVGATPPVKQ